MSITKAVKLSLVASIYFALSSCTSGNSQEATNITTDYSISGKIENPVDSGTVILATFDPVSQVKAPLDTAEVSEDGSYQLNFEFTEADLFQVSFQGKQKVMLAIAEGQSEISLNVEGVSKGKVSIDGSPDSQKLLAYDNFRQESYLRVIKPTYDAMRAASKVDDHEAEVEAVMNYGEASTLHRKELIGFTTEHIGTSIALYGSMLRWTGDDEIAKLEELVDNFKVIHPNLKMTKVMADKVERYKKTAIGTKTPAIALADTLGNTLSLAETKGKYTLIDFWASWCGPCLLQIPDLKEAYQTFHPKGFEILSVSIDTKEDRWKSAITKYDMEWPQISDLKGWGSQSARDYNVTFIPFNLLIDSEGTIIAKNLHSKALEKKLEQLLND